MNKRAQYQQGGYSIFTIAIIAIIFVIVLGVGLAPIINANAHSATTLGGLTGIEAFFMDNLLLVIIIAFILWLLWMVR